MASGKRFSALTGRATEGTRGDGAAFDHDRTPAGEDRVLHFPMQDAGLPDCEPEACMKGAFTWTDGNVYQSFYCDALERAGR